MGVFASKEEKTEEKEDIIAGILLSYTFVNSSTRQGHQKASKTEQIQLFHNSFYKDVA